MTYYVLGKCKLKPYLLILVIIQVGDKLPTIPLYEGSPTNKVNLAELFGNKKGVVFAVPGAFTPGCSKVRLRFLLNELIN